MNKLLEVQKKNKEEDQQVEIVLNNEEQHVVPAIPATWNQQIAHYLQTNDYPEGLDRSKQRYSRLDVIPYALKMVFCSKKIIIMFS